MSEMITTSPRVPEEWRDDAEEMGISLSEYMRRMVRAGRRQWGYEHEEEPDQPTVRLDDEARDPSDDINAILQDTIVRNLSTMNGISEEELIEILIDDLEKQIETHLQELMDDEVVEYSPIKGGWVKR